MKIILMSYGEWPEEMAERFNGWRARIDKDLVALIEKRLNDIEGSRAELAELYCPSMHINEDSSIGKRLADNVRHTLGRAIDEELGKYHKFRIETIPDEATYATVFEDGEGVEHVIYMVDGQLYVDEWPEPNLLKELNDGDSCE